MQYLVILSKIPNETIGLVIGLFFSTIFVIYGIDQIFHRITTHKKQPVIIMPSETLQLKDIATGTTIFILDSDKEFVMAQTIENYQEGIITRTFKNTFWFDTEGKHTLEKGKTYQVSSVDNEGTKTLNKVSLFITRDSIVVG